MGRPKGGIVHDERTLAARAASQLAPVCSEVVIGVAPGAENPAPEWPAVEDAPPAGRGPLAGIDAAFTAFVGRDLLVLACDYPRIDTPLLRALVARAAGTDDDLVVLEDGSGRVHPLVGVWRHAAATAVRETVRAGSLRVADLLDRVRAARLGPRELPEIDLDRALVNWNRPEDIGPEG